MMPSEIRLELLKITRPTVDRPDIGDWLKRAKELETYVCGAGQPETAPLKQPQLTLPQTGQPQRGPAHRK